MSTEEPLPPNYQKLDVALRSIGYSFEAAVADVIDNSIDAHAARVLVRFIITRSGHLDLAVLDDGRGMNEQTLREAMRFGADVSHEIRRLGKFGLGLKLASLSQAREVRVVSAVKGSVVGRAWTEHGIARGFTSTVFDCDECTSLLTQAVPEAVSGFSGTLVLWSRLYRVGHQRNAEEHAQKLMRRLENYLSLAFHRFLSGRSRRVKITLDIFDQKAASAGVPISLDPLDPFAYEQSGKGGFPAAMNLAGHYQDRISMTAHIWPPNSTAAQYRLPGGANSRQGFYFYRHNRLIQGGGWNGLREVEPHASLARLEIDIAADFDLEVSLDVKKVEIHLPPDLVAAIQSARTASGIDFKRYMSLADEAYRKRTATQSELPLIPSHGLPSELTEFLHRELRLKSTAKHRDLKIRWKLLDKSQFFDIDRDAGQLHINRLYRKRLLHGLPGSATDLPVVKCLLFFVLEDALGSERIGPRIRERLEQVNKILVRAVKHERRTA